MSMCQKWLRNRAFGIAKVLRPLAAYETVSARFPQRGDPETESVHASQQI
jgi:hypothetical protein